MKLRPIVPLCGLLLVVLFLNGCVAAIGNRDSKSGGTLGQQLIDLKAARDAGAMSESEYQTERAKLLENR